MTSSLEQKLLAQKLLGLGLHEAPRKKPNCFSRQNTCLNEEERLKSLQSSDLEQDSNHRLRRKFLYRLAIALHSYGSSASRTEYLIERAAERLDVGVKIAVFPSLILLSFSDHADESSNESHLITVESSLDVDKLGLADELANNVGKHDMQLLIAYWELRMIAISHSLFESWWWRLFSFALSASTAALLFFDGSLWDAFISFILGLAVGALDTVSRKVHILGNLTEFTASLTVSFLARVFATYLTRFRICFSNVALSSLVQLLPGMTLTLGVSEMVAKSHVTGSSFIIYTLFSALQLGFGLSVGENLASWTLKQPISDTCESPKYPFWWNILWFLGYTVSSNVLLNARLKQWPGMTIASGAGYIVSALTGKTLGSDASSVLAALSVSVTGTIYSYFTGDLPLVMVLSGVLLLVPGGLGVQGIHAMLQDDVISGMGFVFQMLVVGLAITIGLLMAKVILPAKLIGFSRRSAHDKATLAAQFEEEDMAI